jgi:hypothetical protein
MLLVLCLFCLLVFASLMWVIVVVALDWLGGCCMLCYSGCFSDLLRSADSKLHYCTGDFGVISMVAFSFGVVVLRLSIHLDTIVSALLPYWWWFSVGVSVAAVCGWGFGVWVWRVVDSVRC